MTTVSPQSKRPTHEVFYVKGEAEQAIWMKVGAAWANRDGEGYSIVLEMMPIGVGRLMMRKYKPKPEQAPAAPASDEVDPA